MELTIEPFRFLRRPGSMFQRFGWGVCVGAIGLLACQPGSRVDAVESASAAAATAGTKGSAAPQASAGGKAAGAWAPVPPPGAPKGPLKVNIEGAEVELKYGRVDIDYGFGNGVVVLSDKPLACTGSEPSDAIRVSFPMEPGPGGKLVIGTPVALAPTSSGPAIKTPWDTRSLALTLTEVGTEPGKRVKGSVAIDFFSETDPTKPLANGGGEIDLEVCAAIKDKQVELPDFANTPLAGKIGGAAFTPKTVLARVVKVPGGQAIDHVYFFPEAAGCDAMMDAHSGRRPAVVVSVNGLEERRMFSGAPQRGSISFTKLPEGTPSTMYGGIEANTWVEIERLAFKAGQTMRGRMVSATLTDPKPAVEHQLNGVFEAKICE